MLLQFLIALLFHPMIAPVAVLARPVVSSGPSVANAACFTPGNVSSYTTAAVNTTGAQVVVVTMSYDEGDLGTITDNHDSKALTQLTPTRNGSYASLIAYEFPSSTGSATFSYTGSGNMFAQMCVIPIVGLTGVYDGSNPGANGTTSCTAGSITPGSGTHMAIAAYSGDNTSVATIGGSYTIIGQAAAVSATNFAGGAAYLSTGSATNPTWSMATATVSTCSIASFH